MDIGIPPGYVNGRGGRVITTAEWEAECFAEQVAAAVMREKQEARLQKAVAAAMGTVPQPPRSEQIYRLAERIDQHLDVVEEKIEGIMVRPPSPTEIAIAARAAAYSEFAVAPPAYSEIAVAPPVYAEAPRDNLAAELAQMKAMMEQMRLEKERMETEARRKAAEDAKRKVEQEKMMATLRMEQEEARELEEIHKKLHESNMKSYGWHLDDRNQAILTSIARHETALFYEQSEKKLTYIITNKNIYRVWGFGYPIPKLGLIYTFDTTLTKKQTLFLEKGVARTDCEHGPLLSRVSHLHYGAGGGAFDRHLSAPKKFESVIRLIPGSYKNGDWCQLDGFFGMYFNETTMEVSELPPPSL